MRPVIDSSVLIDYLHGVEAAKQEIERYDTPFISAMSWLEVMSEVKNDLEEKHIRRFLYRFEVVEVDEDLREQAAKLRRQRGLEASSAIALAAAIQKNTILITRNSSYFPKDDPMVRMPYAA